MELSSYNIYIQLGEQHNQKETTMKKNKKNNNNVVTADAPRNYVFLAMKKMTGSGSHGKRGYNRKVGKKVDFS